MGGPLSASDRDDAVRTDVVEVYGDVGGRRRTDEARLDERCEAILHVEPGAAFVILRTTAALHRRVLASNVINVNDITTVNGGLMLHSIGLRKC